MNLNELRLGNYVYGIDPNNKECGMAMCKVQCIYMDGAELNGIEVPLCAEYIEPIELTSDILVKCGFNKTKLDGCDCHFTYTKYNGSLKFKITALYDADFSVCVLNAAKGIKYLHQLQNLYFSINGKELEVKL